MPFRGHHKKNKKRNKKTQKNPTDVTESFLFYSYYGCIDKTTIEICEQKLLEKELSGVYILIKTK